MQNARDTFYLALRNQLTLVNPERLLTLRGVLRPGIVVEENESAVVVAAPDIFVLRWNALTIDDQHALPLTEQLCAVNYWTEGTSTNGGLDRGRLLSAMDSDLTQMLGGLNAAKQNFGATPPSAMATRVFWSTPAMEPIVVAKNRISRVAQVRVYSYEEASEL
jgi:hypothetical protein